MPTANVYKIKKQFLLVRDASDFVDENSKHDPELVYRFRDAMAIFRTRIELLGSLEHKTTKSEEESMSAMLEVLYEGKRRLTKQKNGIIS